MLTRVAAEAFRGQQLMSIKAAEWSINIAALSTPASPRSSASIWGDNTFNTAVSVECNGLKPDWNDGSRLAYHVCSRSAVKLCGVLLASKALIIKSWILICTTHSWTRPTSLFNTAFLIIGVMNECLKQDWNRPAAMEVLHKWKMYGATQWDV